MFPVVLFTDLVLKIVLQRSEPEEASNGRSIISVQTEPSLLYCSGIESEKKKIPKSLRKEIVHKEFWQIDLEGNEDYRKNSEKTKQKEENETKYSQKHSKVLFLVQIMVLLILP